MVQQYDRSVEGARLELVRWIRETVQGLLDSQYRGGFRKLICLNGDQREFDYHAGETRTDRSAGCRERYSLSITKIGVCVLGLSGEASLSDVPLEEYTSGSLRKIAVDLERALASLAQQSP